MQEHINNFIKAMKAQGKSKCTIEAYGIDLKQFAGSMEKSLDEIKYADLQMWANSMAVNGLSASSRARKISAVKSFFKWLYKMELINRNPADGLESPKLEKKEPKVISMDEASEVLFCARNSGESEHTWFRNYAIVSMFMYTGIRREELTNIKLEDVNLQDGKILIHGKGNKQRTVYLNDKLLPIISEYIMRYRHLLKPASTSKYLFPSAQTEKMCTRSVNDVVNTMFDKAGIKEKGISAHILRKRFATSAFNATGDIATVSKMLGHSSPTVTMRYVAIGETSMRNAVNAVNF